MRSPWRTDMAGRCPFASRRAFLGGAGGALAALGVAKAQPAAKGITEAGRVEGRAVVEPFWGTRQGGIMTALQNHTYFAAFDLVTDKAGDVARLLTAWTNAAARLAAGDTTAPLGSDLTQPAPDTGEALGMAAARLTLTFGFGPGLFELDDRDRYGLAALRPEALEPLPVFHGDELEDARTGGDLSCRPARTTRRSPSTPCGRWPGWRTAWPASAGCRPASRPMPRHRTRRAT